MIACQNCGAGPTWDDEGRHREWDGFRCAACEAWICSRESCAGAEAEHCSECSPKPEDADEEEGDEGEGDGAPDRGAMATAAEIAP